MSNMSYCRFENTLGDLQDCEAAIRDGEVSDLSASEARALQEMFNIMHGLVEDYPEYLECGR